MTAARLAVLFLCLATPVRSARADAGELAVGLQLGGAWPAEATAALALRLGLADAWAVELSGGGGLEGRAGRADLRLGLVWLLDIWTLVPEVRLAGGARLGDGLAPVVELDAGARYYLARAWAVALSLGGRWSPGEGAALAHLTLWRALE